MTPISIYAIHWTDDGRGLEGMFFAPYGESSPFATHAQAEHYIERRNLRGHQRCDVIEYRRVET